MFDFVRRNTRILQFVLFLLIVPSFVLFGVEGYSRMSDKGTVVASVDGVDIHQSEWDAAHRAEVDRLRSSMPNLDPRILDTPAARYATLERMVRERVVHAAAIHQRLLVGDQALAGALQQDPVIASLRGPDGRLDVVRYREILARQGLTPEMYEEQVRGDLSRQQVFAGLQLSAFAVPSQAALTFGALLEKRQVQVARFDTATYAAQVAPTDAEVEAFYQANIQLFQAPEEVDIEYLVLDIESIRKGIVVAEADLRSYYEQNMARPAGQEERRASHILVAAPATAPAAERDAARVRAQQLLAEARKAPDRFAELARKHSQDPGSAPRGGDLDFFTRGAMTKAFEDAAFALKKGEISDVVETEFGFHVLRLTDIKVPRQRSFEEVRAELEAQLRTEQAQRKFSETADAFSNAVYEQADTLKPAAERFALPLRTASGIKRQPSAGATGPLGQPKFLDALFASDSLEKKRNTEAVEIGGNQLVSGRVIRHVPARALPLAEVRAAVVDRLKADRGAELAKRAGGEQLKAVQEGRGAALPAPVVISRDEPRQLPAVIVEAALKADPSVLPVAVGVDLGALGYALVKVDKVIARDPPPQQQAAQERDELAQLTAAAEAQAYYQWLQERFKVKIKAPRPSAEPSQR